MALAVKEKIDSTFISKQNLSLLRACVESNNPVLLIGETGTGKTTVIREMAKEQRKTLIRISVNGSMGVEEILGKWLVDKGTTKWQDGVLTDAIRKGHWVVMDEINAALPEILFVLHSLLDDDRRISLPEKDNEIVYPHEEFRFFASMNPPEEYAGTKDMNKALMSRFTAVIHMEVLSEINEAKLLEQKGAPADLAVKLVKIGRVLRDFKKKDQIFYFCSTRDLVQCVGLVAVGLDLADAFVGAVVNKMSPKEYAVVRKEISPIVGEEVVLPVKTVDELVRAVVMHEEEKDKLRKELEVKHAEEVLRIRKEAKAEAEGAAKDEFIERLRKLATS